MLVHRISKTKYINDLSGEGARLFGGRWNRPGLAALYTAEHLSLAVLELIVHFNGRNAFKASYSTISLKITENKVARIEHSFGSKLVNDKKLWHITEKYFLEHKVLAISVPSIIIPGERNVIINPNHPDFRSIKIVDSGPFNIDERFEKVVS